MILVWLRSVRSRVGLGSVAHFSASAPAVARPLLRALSVIPSLPSVLGWFGPVVGLGRPGGAGCGCHSFALRGSRRLAARHPATTRPLIENCGPDRCVGIDRRGRLRAKLASTGRRDLLAPQGSTIGALPPRRWRRGRVLRPHQRVLHPTGAGHVQTPGRPPVDHLLRPAQFRHHRPRGHRTRRTSTSDSNGPGPPTSNHRSASRADRRNSPTSRAASARWGADGIAGLMWGEGRDLVLDHRPRTPAGPPSARSPLTRPNPRPHPDQATIKR